MKFSVKDFFSKCEQIRSFLRMRSHLLKKFLMENFIFCEVIKSLMISYQHWNLFPIGLLKVKWLKNFLLLCTQMMVYCFFKDFGNVALCCNEMGIFNIDLNNINLDDTSYEKGDSGTILIRLLAWHIKFEKQKKLKSEELMPIAWHPKRWWSFWVSEDEKKE